MRRASAGMLAITGLLLPSCALVGASPERLSIDPTRRGFELPPKPIVVFFVDGLRADVLDGLLSRGELPRLRGHFFDRAARVRSAVACVPSVTYANLVTMMTGRWPSVHGVWANVCFDRHQLLTRNYESQRERAEEDRACATVFELMPRELTAVVALPFERGVEISVASSAGDGGAWAWIPWLLGRKRKADELLSEQLHEIARQARVLGEWPALVVVHLPAVDASGHEHGSDGSEYRGAVANLDQAIGGVLEEFERGGMLDDLTVVLVSDHGHHSTPRTLELAEYLQAVLGVDVLLGREDDGGADYLARWERYAPARAVVTTTGEREASLHLRPGAQWHDRPGLEEILAFPSAFGQGSASLPELLLQSPAVQLVALRAGDGEVQVHGRPGSASIERIPSAAGPTFRYRLLSGRDPLGYDQDGQLWEWIESGAHASRDWLAATADRRHPDLVPQLVAAFDHPRSGDVVAFAAPSWGFSSEYSGGHGGIEREEMIVPLFLAGPDVRPGSVLPAARLVDLVPTLLDLIDSRAPDHATFDGVSLLPLLR